MKIRKILLLIALLAVLVSSLFYVLRIRELESSPAKRRYPERAKKEPKEKIKPIFYYCPLCGGATQNEHLIRRRPLIIKVENSPSARPQSGLGKACVVYEMQVEGGITRFTAIYLCQEADSVGPVRSARLDDATLVPQYDGIFAHCGGQLAVKSAIRAAGVTDLDEMVYGPPTYWRVRNKRAPHNLYTSTRRLRELAERKGFDGEITYQGFLFKEDSPETTPAATLITIPDSHLCTTQYQYDKNSNSYLRFIRKIPHIDGVTGNQIKVKNIVVLYTQKIVTDLKDKTGSRSPRFPLSGQGEAIVFQDGRQIKGFWEAGTLTPPSFFDEKGNTIFFNRGNTWIEVVPLGVKVIITSQ